MAPLGPQKIDLDASLRNLQNGGLPTRALLRLKDEAAGPDKKLFTSDLSVNEFLVTREVQCLPISQVMGSSIYHIGKIADYKGETGEIKSLSFAHRDARQRAINRLTLEAKAVKADAVIGVHLAERMITKGSHGKGGDDGDEIIEFTVVGTAVQAPWLVKRSPDEPIVTDLSGQDFWALAREGWEPVGLVFDFCRYHVFHVMDPSSWTAGNEITAAAQGVQKAREIVMSRINAQAKHNGAEFVVGADIQLDVHEVPCGWGGCHLNDLDIDVAWFGTGIRHVHTGSEITESRIPPLLLGMMPLGKRKKGELLEDDEDESAELKKEAREEEERAAEEAEKEEKRGGGE